MNHDHECLNLSKTPDEFVYETDETYQKLFQDFFCFQEEHLDEIGDVYDVDQVKKGMDYILLKTSQVDPWWNQLYIKAAAMFMSIDQELGLCVCLNFSYFDLFYKILYCIVQDIPDERLPAWKEELIKRLD